MVEDQYDFCRIEADIRKRNHVEPQTRESDEHKSHRPVEHDRYKSKLIFGIFNRPHCSCSVCSVCCVSVSIYSPINNLSLIHISEPTRLGMISYAVFCLK